MSDRKMDKSRIETPAREMVLRDIAEAIVNIAGNARITLVAIDGVDGAGKTTFDDELDPKLRAAGKPVIRATVDAFHQPRAIRNRLGRSSPEGFFRDSYDYAALKRALLDPLRAGGSQTYRRAIFDVEADNAVDASGEAAIPGSILLFDGIFLHRFELRDYWHFSIFLDVPWENLSKRPSWAISLPDPSTPDHRYAEGQRIYFRECNPKRAASVVIDNADLANPVILDRRR